MPTSDLTWNDWLRRHQAAGLVDISTAFGSRSWEPTEADRKAAWTLYTQLRTRIATQALHYRAGDEETALDSLFKLFDLTRETLDKQGPDCRNLATITTLMLNRHIRPLTAKWHKKKVDERLQHDDDRRAFRRELDALRPKLLVFCRLLASLAAAEPELREDDTCALPRVRSAAGTSGPIAFDGTLMDRRLYGAELTAIRARRQQEGPVRNLAGLALSGGGIRSATFCQGVIQALARRGVMPGFDYLSTVSGGGYFGAFLSSFLNDDDANAVGLGREQLPFARQGGAESPPLRHLRNESKYLLKGGVLGQARILGLLCLGILVNLLAVAPLFLLMLAVTKWITAAGIDAGTFGHGVDSLLQLLIGLLVLVVLALPLAYRWLAGNRQTITWIERVGIGIAVAIPGVWLTASGLPQVYAYLRDVPLSAPAVIGLFTALPFGLAGASFLLGPERLPGRVLMIFAGFTGPLFLVMTFLALNDWIPGSDGANALLLLFLAVVVFAWLSQINVNQISPHRYYRNRLAETYLLGRQPSEDADRPTVRVVDPQPLPRLRSANLRPPYHLINAAVNLPASKNAELRGRRADFFVFTQDYCGSPLTDYCPTEQMREKDPNLDLGTAMAISGAAASSFMGTKSLPSLSFWLALLNVRLAYWLPNPGRVAELRTKSGMSPISVWRELFGRLDETSDYLNVSDGGHIENLGIYELLRRKCKYIVAIDAEADPDMGFGSLMQLMRYAEIDFGIRIALDLDDLLLNKKRRCKAHFAFGTIDYGGGQTGYLLLIKSSLTGNEPDYVRDYQQRCPTFPHETTADQFFSEAQFEAYRALGEHIGDDLFQPELIGRRDSISLERWFDGMRRNLLAP